MPGAQTTEIAYRPLEDNLPITGEHILLKTGRVTSWDRWSILGWDPWLQWRPRRDTDPWRECEILLGQIQRDWDFPSPHPPIPCLMGAFAYDAGRSIEQIPTTAQCAVTLPDGVLYGFRQYLIADEVERRAWRVEISAPHRMAGDVGGAPMSASSRATVFAIGKKKFASDAANGVQPTAGPAHAQGMAWSSNFTRAQYIAAVEQIRAMIAAGDCYQVNLSQQIQVPCHRSAVELFRAALRANPAPMMALVNAGDFQLISTSPERLVRRRGEALVSRPIKGTRARGETPDADRALLDDLTTNDKDNAELAMIIDLIRNDLGRVACPGSVVVTEPKVVESYANVHHLLATIAARTPLDTTWPDIFRALFPGGSVTGCPKVQAMRVIEAMEGVRRGFYCGSIGYIDVNGDGDWNIAIRTLTKIGERVVFNLGGAVTYDSDPVKEYEETLHKGETLFNVLRGTE